MNLDYFTRLKQGSTSQNRGLLANPLQCGACNRAMDLVERGTEHVDGFQR